MPRGTSYVAVYEGSKTHGPFDWCNSHPVKTVAPTCSPHELGGLLPHTRGLILHMEALLGPPTACAFKPHESAHWARFKDVFPALHSNKSQARGAIVADASAGADTVRSEVERLLAAHSSL